MTYTIGEPQPNPLYAWPLEKSPVTHRSYSPIATAIHWLLLNPSGNTLFFIEDYGINAPKSLIEYTIQTGQRRVVLTSRSLRLFQRPVWLDRSRLLVISDFSLVTLDIQTGTLTSLLKRCLKFALSGDGTRLLVNSSDGPYPSDEFHLYEFPSLRLLQTLPQKFFAKSPVELFCFAGKNHVLFVRRKALFSIPTDILDLQSLKFRNVTKSMNGLVYLSECLIIIE